ncbi:hypothetical protein MHYP_G00180180 [Metynnis hypsauchen]
MASNVRDDCRPSAPHLSCLRRMAVSVTLRQAKRNTEKMRKAEVQPKGEHTALHCGTSAISILADSTATLSPPERPSLRPQSH